MATRETFVEEVIGIVKSHGLDNNQVYSTIDFRRSSRNTVAILKQFTDPYSLNSKFYLDLQEELLRRISEVEGNEEWTICLAFSIFGGTKPNDLNLIAIYNRSLEFELVYRIETDLSVIFNHNRLN